VGTLAREAEGMLHLVVDRLDDLTHPGQPTARTFGPGMPALPLRRANHLGRIVIPPARMSSLSLEAFIADIKAQGGLPNAWAFMSAISAYSLLRTKLFHEVSSGNQHPYLLK
jgi:hypothetical protein